MNVAFGLVWWLSLLLFHFLADAIHRPVMPRNPETVTTVVGANTTIVLDLSPPESQSCGVVSINGYVGTAKGSITGMIWNWGDGTTNYSWFPAQHTYTSNGTYSVVVTAVSDIGETFARSQALRINSVEPRCRDSLRIYPPFVVLRGGKTNEMLTIDLRGPEGERVAWRLADAIFESSNPELVQVRQDGMVTALGFGHAEIRVSLKSHPGRAVVPVTAGEVRLEPCALVISLDGPKAGQLTLKAVRADGAPISLDARDVGFWGGNEVAEVGVGGWVTAVRSPVRFHETPYISATVDGIDVPNACFVRVTTTNLNLAMKTYEGQFVSFAMADRVGPYAFGSLMSKLEVVKVFDSLYAIQQRLTGTAPSIRCKDLFGSGSRPGCGWNSSMWTCRQPNSVGDGCGQSQELLWRRRLGPVERDKS